MNKVIFLLFLVLSGCSFKTSVKSEPTKSDKVYESPFKFECEFVSAFIKRCYNHEVICYTQSDNLYCIDKKDKR